MITISLATVGLALMKMCVLLFIMAIGAMIILWPVNDKPVSKTQKVIFAVYSICAALTVFGVIRFV
jgi:hypothetical protein